MNAQEAEMVTGILFSAFPQRPVSEETAALYQRMLLDLPVDLAQAAVLDAITRYDWLPSIAQIRKAVFDLTDDSASAGDAWAEVTHAIRHGGHMYAVVAGLRFDTSAMGSGGNGPRWRATKRSPRGFVARHPAGL